MADVLDASAARDPYRSVLEVGAALASSLDPDEVTQTIARLVGEALDVQSCDINEYDAEARTLTYVAAWSRQMRRPDVDYLGTVVDLNERPGRDAVIRKGDVLASYVDDEDLDAREREMMARYGEKAVMEVPLVFDGEPLGVLGVVESRDGRRFTEEEMELLRLLARPAATALGNARVFRRQQDQSRRLATLLNASRALAASVDLDEVLAGVARLAAEAVQASYATVYEYRPHHDALLYRALYQRDDSPSAMRADQLGTAYRLADYPGERAILARTSAVQEHVSDPDLPEDRRRAMEEWRQYTCLSLPLRTGGTAQGILRVTSLREERDYSAAELELVDALADAASVVIHNARLFRAQEEESQRLLMLLEVCRRLGSTFDRGVVATALEEGACRLLDELGDVRVWLRAAGEPLEITAVGVAGDLAREALARRRPAERVADDGSGVAVPLVVKERIEGVLTVRAEGHRRFTSAEREALQVLTNHAAAVLENQRLYRRAEREAVRDGLTGLYNHRYFHERLRQECRRSARYGTPLSLLMLDLDDFKSFNDLYGHQVGDETLREVGQILFTITRQGVDLAARYGGEEFAVILPHTPASDVPLDGSRAVPDDPEAPPPAGAGALVVAERVRATIAGHAFLGYGGRRHAHTTVTVGVAELREGEGAASLLEAADAALYQGKHAGRDRVVKRG